MSQHSAHLAYFWVGEHFLLDLLSASERYWFRLEMPSLPADARLVGVRHEWQKRAFCVLVESASFAKVPEGDEIPLLGELHVNVKTEPDVDTPAIVEAP